MLSTAGVGKEYTCTSVMLVVEMDKSCKSITAGVGGGFEKDTLFTSKLQLVEYYAPCAS